MNFDRLAPHYDWMETVSGHRLLQRARTAQLAALPGRRRTLSVGEGHGRFAAACAARFPDAELTCVEASPRMLARARQRLEGHPVCWHGGKMESWIPEGKYDAIVTCFFLDCFPPDQLAAIVAKLAACATADAVWLVTDFALPARGPARWRARAVHALMYGFFRLAVDLPARKLTPPDDLLRKAGFALTARKEFNWGLLRADQWRRS